MVAKDQIGSVGLQSHLPKIVVTRPPHEHGTEAAEAQFKGERLQVRLLTLDERYRSYLLYHQIKIFEEKVYYSYDNFDVDIFLRMFRELARRCRGTRDIYTVAGLRSALNQEVRRIRMRKRNKRLPPSEEDPGKDDVIEYFTWFFQNFNYLRELRGNYITRVFNPLFKYFYDVGSNGPDRERSSDSAMSFSNLSLASHRSIDSGVTGLSGWSSLRFSDTESHASGDEDIHTTRKRIISRAALQLLSRQMKDVKQLYDTTEIEKTAHRLSFMKDQLDFLIDNEAKIPHEMFSQDSEKAVCHLKVKNSRTYFLMRLIPDILVKLQLLAWLARKWLELDDKKTKDLKQRLAKLAKLEEQLTKRMNVLTREIQDHERNLGKETNQLQELLKREERVNELELSLHVYEESREKLAAHQKELEKEKKDINDKIQESIKGKKTMEFKTLQTMYERNKLQRYAVERQLATLQFHKNVAQTDMQIEMEVKANIIHFTNDVQDHCEELEKQLERERKEKRTIQAALIPISKDREIITDRLREREYPLSTGDEIIAEYVGSSRIPLPVNQHGKFAHAFNPNGPGHVRMIEPPPRNANLGQKQMRPFPQTMDSDWA
ncbi:hypothetical protein FSP39_013439 [Pinctada imbricata]|uniref:Uncharacterized protein n=1 Tax=Pinctada imbricata TaxID=66713 RepID=A0AA89CAQ4_PINIB|nr:hypothetical protein FSP39_013439 [Pinctada imbricata]